jgi:hypothetical protein
MIFAFLLTNAANAALTPVTTPVEANALLGSFVLALALLLKKQVG